MPPHESPCLRQQSTRWRLPFAMAVVVLCAAVAPAVVRADETAASPPPGHVLVREASDYGWRTWLRRRVYKPSDDARYGLQFDANWQAAPADVPLVVLVHGFNSTPGRNEALLQPIRAAGLPCAGFAYPNDHALAESAVRLSAALKKLAASHPRRRVSLVTHSMGGLVARACVEDAALDPGNVVRLIQIAPPNHGTQLAHAAVATDVWEHWLGRKRGAPWTRWRDSIVDGLGEAGDDLAPGSPFLMQLNARSRNPDVTYAILLGTAASVSEDEMDWIRDKVAKASGRVPGLRKAGRRFGSWLDDMEELVDGKGDGVVAVKRGRLQGVDDIALLPFGHLSCTAAGCDDGLAVQREVLARLR